MANALIHQKSPYLLQHAHNPVDWLPWGDEAFARARAEDKLVFLSIGYSTCHWCHVMERESFENHDIAALLNEHFISVKVDREERPDVDQTYMAYVVATTGHGGWPMSVWLTPDRRPIYGGTYYPPDDRTGRVGFPTVLQRLNEVWKSDRDHVLANAEQAVKALQQMRDEATPSDAIPGDDVFRTAFEQMSRMFDDRLGGFGRAPKFPRASLFFLLSRLAARFGPESPDGRRCVAMLEKTLTAMAHGGLHDHLGGGFHRYSVDAYWHVPHYEKMLYDQAQLAISYLEAWQITGRDLFREALMGVLRYVERDMRSPEGGFYSAEDADSLLKEGDAEKHEGAFYTWTHREIVALLPPEVERAFSFHYWIRPGGNARPESDPLGELAGRNTPCVMHSVDETATACGTTAAVVTERLAEALEVLKTARARRPRPHLDDKILVSWNGLMISAFARAGGALGWQPWLDLARQALVFLREKLYVASEGTLRRSFREGASAVPGFADDYAFLIQGCLDFYEATGESEWLRWAVRLQEKLDARFWDDSAQTYRLASNDGEAGLVPLIDWHDGAEPSPISVAALNLFRLAQMLDRAAWRERGEALLKSGGGLLTEQPFSMPYLAAALDFALGGPTQIVLTGGDGAEELRREALDGFRPNRVVLTADGAAGQAFLASHVPSLAFMTPVKGLAAAYVCHHFTCRAPVVTPEALRLLLDSREERC